MTTPIVCELTPEAVRARRNRLLPGLASRAHRTEDTPDGYRLFFDASGDTLRRIAEVIDAERPCCRWLRFDLTVPPSPGFITLTLSGPPGAREFLSALFDA